MVSVDLYPTRWSSPGTAIFCLIRIDSLSSAFPTVYSDSRIMKIQMNEPSDPFRWSKYRKLNICVFCLLNLSSKPQMWSFHVLLWQRTARTCSQVRAARAAHLFFLIQSIILICGAAVVVDVVHAKVNPFCFTRDSKNKYADLWQPRPGGGGVLGSFFAGYVPLASPNPYPIIVYSVANHKPHLSHFWATIIFAIPT